VYTARVDRDLPESGILQRRAKRITHDQLVAINVLTYDPIKPTTQGNL
jgi:hypothetical protein